MEASAAHFDDMFKRMDKEDENKKEGQPPPTFGAGEVPQKVEEGDESSDEAGTRTTRPKKLGSR